MGINKLINVMKEQSHFEVNTMSSQIEILETLSNVLMTTAHKDLP